MVSKLVKLAVGVPAALALTSYSLYAVSDRTPRGTRLSPAQLSLYSVPPRGSEFMEERPGRVQCAVTTVRTSLSPAVTWSQSCVCAVGAGVEEAVQLGHDTYTYLKNPPPEFLPRLGVISFSWLTGLILARRGSRLKRIIYPVGLTALGASVCYPAHAVFLAKVTGRKLYNGGCWTYDTITSLWKTEPRPPPTTPEDPLPVTSHEPLKSAESHGTEEPITAEPVTSLPEEPITAENTEPPTSPAPPPSTPEGGSTTNLPTAPVKSPKFTAPPSLSDYGQSSPEDQDLYSTRS